MELLTTGENILKISVSMITVLTAVYKIWFKKWYAGYKASRNEFRVAVFKRFDETDAKVNRIDKQVNPNSGSSLPDSNVRMEKVLGELVTAVGGIVLSQRNLREISGIASWESDETGAVIYASPSLCEIYGVSADHLIQYTWVSLILPRDLDRCLKAWEQTIKYGTPYEIYLTIKKPDGYLIDIHATAIHTKKDGKVVNTLGRVEVVKQPYKEL